MNDNNCSFVSREYGRLLWYFNTKIVNSLTFIVSISSTTLHFPPTSSKTLSSFSASSGQQNFIATLMLSLTLRHNMTNLLCDLKEIGRTNEYFSLITLTLILISSKTTEGGKYNESRKCSTILISDSEFKNDAYTLISA